MANAHQNKVIEKLIGNQYTDKGQLSNDLAKANFSSSRSSALADQYISSRSSTSNSSSTISCSKT